MIGVNLVISLANLERGPSELFATVIRTAIYDKTRIDHNTHQITNIHYSSKEMEYTVDSVIGTSISSMPQATSQSEPSPSLR